LVSHPDAHVLQPKTKHFEKLDKPSNNHL